MPELRTRNLVVSGAVDQDEAHRIFEDNYNAYLYCYEKELRDRAELVGVLELTVVLGTDGSVDTATVADSSLDDPVVESCVERVARRMRFEMARSKATVIQELHFSSVKQEREVD